MLFSDFIVPSWESNKFIQTISTQSLFNLILRSHLIIIYDDDRCAGESQVLNYFRIEQDKLWIWFEYLIYQLIAFRILGYFALYIQVNSEFYLKKLLIKNKLFKTKLISHLQPKKALNTMVKYDKMNGIKNIEYIQNEPNEMSSNSNKIGQNIVESNDETSISLAIAWNNLSFSIKSLFNKEKLILNNLKGSINFGTISALVGPSGAGKTTLLHCINGMKRSGLNKNTEVYVNKSNKIKSVFIVQEHKHHLLMNLTVRESLMYSSLLKNSNQRRKHVFSNGQIITVNDLEKIVLERIQFNHKLNVNQILSELMLTNCADNKVSQCSGGEQKRLAIGLELTPKIKPNLICIDEPTTGLDSYAAEQVIKSI